MRLGHTIHHLSVTTSTMDEVERLAAEGAEEGLVVVANEQTAGRGRAGRTWVAPPGTALLCSILLRPPLPPNRLSTLPLIAGVAVAEAIEDCAPVACQLKWPNDVWIEGRKVAGVVMSAATSKEKVERVVLGVGINLTSKLEDLPPGATSILDSSGVAVSSAEILRRFAVQLGHRYEEFLRLGGAPDLASWRGRAALTMESVTVVDAGASLSGLMHGVDDTGALLVEVGGNLRRIVAGDLSRGPVNPLRQPADQAASRKLTPT